MRGAISTFWGKLSRDEPREWHPLLHHCADVAACCEALLTRTLLGQRLAVLGGIPQLDDVQIARLSALAALHDIGKFNRGFQAKAGGSEAQVCGHVQEVLALFSDGTREEGDRLVRVLPMSDLAGWGKEDAALQLLVAAIGHHGRPHPCEPPPNFNRSVWSGSPFGDPFHGIAELVAVTRRWFPRAFEGGGAKLPPNPAFQHFYAGLVMLADWLGSHREMFPYSEALDVDRMAFARAAALTALLEVGLDVDAPRRALGYGRPDFATISPHTTPQPAQAKTAELLLEAGGSLTILEAETGSGKTEAALLRFAQLFHAGVVDGMYFALPTRTAATQIHRRVLEAVDRAFPTDKPPVVLAVPGYLRVDDVDGKRLPGFEVLWNDDARERMRFRGWAAENPKRYLAGTVVVGTIDQILLSTIMVSHAHLRATAAARQLLVIDEVHASDAYMNCLLEQVLAFHLRGGGHAFLMSATLGADARTRLLNAVGAEAERPSLERAQVSPYPALTHLHANRAVEVLAVEHRGRVKTIRPRLLDVADDPRAVARHAIEAAQRGARVLVVRNLVRDCIATQEALEAIAEERGATSMLFRAGGVVAPHHSRFAREDREILDHAVEAEFGKGRPSGRGSVLIATQTVEQSLDLDADLLLTDLCPMDVLLQRIGRLHRHQRGRPADFEDPTAVVLVPNQRDLGRFIHASDGLALGPHGYGPVYADMRILEATWRACEEHERFEIPTDNRHLVEATTHPEALSTVTRELGDTWRRHEEHLRGRLATDRQIAKNVLVDRRVCFGEARFLDKEEVGKIASRLGNDDRAVSFATQTGPFGASITGLVILHHMLRGTPENPLALVPVEVGEGRLTFRYGDATYRYDRLGLRLDVAP